MSYFVARIVDGRQGVEEPLDMSFGRKSAGADPGETGV